MKQRVQWPIRYVMVSQDDVCVSGKLLLAAGMTSKLYLKLRRVFSYKQQDGRRKRLSFVCLFMVCTKRNGSQIKGDHKLNI